MLRTDFYYDLPQELIAQEPLPERCGSRLLCLNSATGEIEDRKFIDLCTILQPEDLLVFNDTRVIPARIFGSKKSGGKIEILVERIVVNDRILVQIGASKPPWIGSELILEDRVTALVEARAGEFYQLRINDPRPVNQVLEEIGHVPLPPYIRHSAGTVDAERYQTVYARTAGAVAAPTAGLHFDQNLMDRIRSLGVRLAFVTLHVGAATFQPVRVDNICDHRMHHEFIEVPPSVCEQVRETRQRGGRVIAVGTTVVRCLEAVSTEGGPLPFRGETEIFIYPGYEFITVDAMITNFHMPESTLLMLVCAFAGRQNIFDAYHHAISQRYRFYSYGDAMFVS